MTSDLAIPRDVTLIACGMFLWDYLATLWLELKFVRGQMRLRWPMIPYFLARYSALGFVIGCLIFNVTRRPLNCDVLYVGGSLLGKVAITSASANLAVRSAVIWKYQRYIVLSLGTLIIVEVILIGVGVLGRGFFATWNDEVQHCIGSTGSQKNDLGFFAPYALFVDCVIAGLTVIGLRKFDRTSGFAAVLVRQGLYFFGLVLFFQIFVTAAVFSKDSDVLIASITVLCVVIVPMVSCHLVRSFLRDSSSTSGPCADTCGSTTATGTCLRDGIQLTMHVELGSRSSSC